MAFNLFKKSKPAKKIHPKAAESAQVEIESEVKTEAAPVIFSNSSVLHTYISEKASRLEAMNQYVFKVSRYANKPEVKKAIQKRYGVSVMDVNMVNMPSKKRTVGRHVGQKSGYRKAIVTLAKGESINAK